MTGHTQEVNAYAKINLSLDVLGRRLDGYHEVSMVMQLIGLHDFVRVSLAEGPAGCRIQCEDAKIPAGPENLIYRAWELFAGKTGAGAGFTVTLEKEIPMAAGLAGGSADAAAALLAFNKLLGDPCSLEELRELGAKAGADVPFVLTGIAAMDRNVCPAGCREEDLFVCALATGTGTTLSGLPPLSSEILLVKDPVGVSTKEAYTALDDPAWQGRITERPGTEALLAALKDGGTEAAYGAMANVFEAYTLNAYPEVARTKELLEEAVQNAVQKAGGGPAVIRMSGTGPTLFALSPNGAALDAAAACLAGADPGKTRRILRSRLLPFDR